LPSDRPIRWFEDILDNIERTERFTAGLSKDAFLADERITFAVLHALLIISEAARRLGADAERLAPGQPWRAIRALGNVLRHEYGGVDRAEIWRIVTDDLEPLKRAVQQALRAMREGGPSEEGT
jgi:uncharacterized protein with HEPN domain